LNAQLLEQLSSLETDLAPLTHNPEIIHRVQAFAAAIGAKTRQRQPVLNLPRVLLQAPMTYADAMKRGYSSESDQFSVLQGDVISTQSAFFMGRRLEGQRRFVALTPTCDLVFERREFASLLEMTPITSETDKASELLSSLTAFRRTDSIYFPPLESDLDQGILGFAVSFDKVCSIGNAEIQTATRLASSSLIGWRVFCAMLQSVLTRAGDDEVRLRRSFGPVP
jgi:hypothetical protein